MAGLGTGQLHPSQQSGTPGIGGGYVPPPGGLTPDMIVQQANQMVAASRGGMHGKIDRISPETEAHLRAMVTNEAIGPVLQASYARYGTVFGQNNGQITSPGAIQKQISSTGDGEVVRSGLIGNGYVLHTPKGEMFLSPIVSKDVTIGTGVNEQTTPGTFTGTFGIQDAQAQQKGERRDTVNSAIQAASYLAIVLAPAIMAGTAATASGSGAAAAGSTGATGTAAGTAAGTSTGSSVMGAGGVTTAAGVPTASGGYLASLYPGVPGVMEGLSAADIAAGVGFGATSLGSVPMTQMGTEGGKGLMDIAKDASKAGSALEAGQKAADGLSFGNSDPAGEIPVHNTGTTPNINLGQTGGTDWLNSLKGAFTNADGSINWGAIGTTLSTGAGIWSGYKANEAQADALSEAAKAQERATNKAIDAQTAMYNQTRSDFEPYRQTGLSALPYLQSAAGIPGQKDANGNPVTYNPAESPAAKYAETTGLRTLNRQLAGRGMLGGQGAALAAGELSSGVAAADWDKGYGRLLDLVKTGQGAANSAGAASQNQGNALANLYTGAGQNQSNLALTGGAQQASFYNGLARLPFAGLNTYITGRKEGAW